MLQRILYITYVIFLLFILWFLPSETKSQIAINIYPFRTIALYVNAFIYGYTPLYIIFLNILGNIVFFIPIGTLLYTYIRTHKIIILLSGSIIIPVCIEAVQLVLHLSGFGTRTVDIDDVFLNMLGIWIGYAGMLTVRKVSK